jgi:hypothetical protein
LKRRRASGRIALVSVADMNQHGLGSISLKPVNADPPTLFWFRGSTRACCGLEEVAFQQVLTANVAPLDSHWGACYGGRPF